MTSPIVKWAGGKTRLLPRLLLALPREYRRYYEPFAGGAALFFSLSPSNATLGDTNAGLVRTYRAVASDLDRVIGRLRQYAIDHADPAFFYHVRDTWNLDDGMARGLDSSTPDFEIAAAFIYLNKTCFNGLWRVNKAGCFNVPRGDYDSPPILNEESLREASAVLARADLQVGPYQLTTRTVGPADLVYLDPPYVPLSKTSSFTAYAGAFGLTEQRLLAEHARQLRDQGAYVVASNHDTPLVRELYDGFTIQTVPCGRSINSKGDGRGKVDEVIITSWRSQ